MAQEAYLSGAEAAASVAAAVATTAGGVIATRGVGETETGGGAKAGALASFEAMPARRAPRDWHNASSASEGGRRPSLQKDIIDAQSELSNAESEDAILPCL